MTESSPESGVARAPGELGEMLATAVILAARPGLEIRYINAAGEDLLGLSRRRAHAQPLPDVVALDTDWIRRLEEAGTQGKSLTGRELTLTVADQRRLVDVVVSPVRTETGEEMLVIELTAVDRHRRIAREEALRAQEQANRSLLRGLAHEIRNPLAGLRGAAQLLGRELEEATHAGHTQVIVREADRLRDLVERMIGPAQPMRPAPLNIHEVTERVSALLRAEAGPGVAVTTAYDPSIPALTADRDRMIQAVLNLGRNALQAVGAQGRVTLRTATLRQFTIGAVRHRLVAAIEVIDSGPGIADDQVETLFQPMVSGHAGGSGLGLTIAQTLVSQHGGLVECESEPGHTVFRVILPLSAEPAGEAGDG